MSTITLVAVLCAFWIAAGLIAAHFLYPDHEEPEEPRPTMDLLERKLEIMAAEVAAGWLSEERRRQITAHLVKHAEAIALMEELLKQGPAGSVADAEVIYVPESMPALMIRLHHGYMQTWLCKLYELGYTNVPSQGANPTLHGAVNVTLATTPRVTPLNVRREVAA